ncbi:MAG: tetratricopeptide repeat protein [Pseudomonadota bacterium]
MTGEKTSEGETTLFRELLRRRVFQILGVYLGISFAAFEFTGIIVERYGLSDRLIDVFLVLLLSMLPTVIMLAWFHGAPGKDQWSRVEKFGIPLNIVIAAFAAGTLLSNPSVSAVAEVETRSGVTADGEEFVVEVAPSNLVRRALIFFFDGEAEPTWEQYGLPLLIARAADRGPFVNTMTLYDTDLFWRIERAGYPDGVGVPVSLLQNTAADWFYGHFVTGRLDTTGAQLALDLTLYQTEPLRPMGEVRFTGADIYALADAASNYLTDQLMQEAEAAAASIEYFPIREVLSPVEDALAHHVAARNALTIERDLARSIESAQAAVAADPQFAGAHLFLLRRHLEAGDYESARQVLPDLTRVNNLLLPAQRIQVKALSYELRAKPEEAIEVARTWVEIEPDNAMARNMLANYLWNANRADEAVAEFKMSLELEPNQDWVRGRVGEYHLVRAELDEAAATFEQYHERHPNTYLPLVRLGDIATIRGELDDAARWYRQGNLAQPEMVTPLTKLAENAARRGDYESAESVLEEADLVALALRQQALVAALRSRLATLTGNPGDAVDLLERQLGLLVENGEAFDAWIDQLRATQLYADADRLDDVRSFLAEIDVQFQPPIDFIPSIGYMLVALFEGNLDAAEDHCDRLEQGLIDMNRPDMLHMTSLTRGLIARDRGRLDEAGRLLREALAQYESSIQQAFDDGSADRETILIETARTELERARPREALAAADQIRVSWPHHPEANLLAARAEAALGDVDAARESLARARAGWSSAQADFAPLADAEVLATSLEATRPR